MTTPNRNEGTVDNMIRPHIFKMDSLITALFKDEPDERQNWRREAEIIPVTSASEGTAKWVVTMGSWFLRHSKGPRQGHFWDSYGDDYHTPELALVALLEAEPPAWLIKELGPQPPEGAA